MAKGYWVAFADVNDPEGYKAYIAENAKAFRKYGGHFWHAEESRKLPKASLAHGPL